jgi:hypothetical protein
MHLMKCMGCGAEKDLDVLAPYPYPDDGLVDYPIPQLSTIDCAGVTDRSVWKTAVVCHDCFHRLDPDQWINQTMWENLTPAVPFDRLPNDDGLSAPEKHDPRNFQVKPESP